MKGNTLLEIIWTVVPTLIVIGIFFAGWDSFRALRNAPKDSFQIKVEGKMWSWKFIYPDGRTTNELYVPVGKPVKLNLTSVDVLHSFYVPAFRIKIDAVPGMETYAWFKAEKVGKYDILCAEYCGVRHAYMLSKVNVLTEDEYTKWLKSDNKITKVDQILKKHGCFDCHSTDGSILVGPSFKNIYNRDVVVLEKGKEYKIKSDENYLRESIL
ncbi:MULTISPECIES: cytochrome c oxidase subunit II [Calditerrivibrio]|uniref:cytochrome c oxidase subunit II n=1 Tax=Calditerrivibrio TaxID=545865 RepID=UPI003C73B099